MAFNLVEVSVTRFKRKDEPALHTTFYFILAAKQNFLAEFDALNWFF